MKLLNRRSLQVSTVSHVVVTLSPTSKYEYRPFVIVNPGLLPNKLFSNPGNRCTPNKNRCITKTCFSKIQTSLRKHNYIFFHLATAVGTYFGLLVKTN